MKSMHCSFRVKVIPVEVCNHVPEGSNRNKITCNEWYGYLLNCLGTKIDGKAIR